jgi:ferritin-like metal-binding protein YciE
MKTREELIDWLRDAYAMERGLEMTLKKQAENQEFSGILRAQAQIHLEETRRHAAAVKACLESLDSDPSTLKTGIAESMELIKGMGTMFSEDQRVKDLLAAYASEHFEIACYRALQTAAEITGVPEIAAVCQSIIPDEERMATWLAANLPEVVAEYLGSTVTA